MNNKVLGRITSKQILITFIVVLSIAVINFYIWGDNLNKHLLAGKMFHETTATVIKKEQLAVKREQSLPVGNELGNKPSVSQWRIYYKLDNFDQLSDPLKTEIWIAEQKRISEEIFRYSLKDNEEFEQISVGDKLRVSYRPTANGDIEVANISK